MPPEERARLKAAAEAKRKAEAEAKAAAEAAFAMAPTFYFVAVAVVLAATTVLPRMQVLREQGALTKLAIKIGDAIHGIGVGCILFVSHRWEDPSSPDVAGKQLAAIQEYLRANPHITHVWYDYWCMPQKQDKDTDDRTPVELVEFSSMLSCIADLYLTTKVLILLDNSYVGRFWTMMEAWCAMQVTTPQGVRACESDEEKRYTIKCIWNADEEFDTPKLIKKLSTKTPQEVFEILSSPDVVLTNAKDKVLMLPVVEKTNEHVKELFERAADLTAQGKLEEAFTSRMAELAAAVAAAKAAAKAAKAAKVSAARLDALAADSGLDSGAAGRPLSIAAHVLNDSEAAAGGSGVQAVRALKE